MSAPCHCTQLGVAPILVIMSSLFPQAAAMAGPCTVTSIDSPLEGRVVQLDNGLVRVRIAPQLGGRMLALQRSDGERVIRYKSDWDQAKEVVWCRGNAASISDRPEPAWTKITPAKTGVVRWVSRRPLGGGEVQVTREVAVAAGSPAVHLRVTARNTGQAPLVGVGYTFRMHLFLPEGASLEAGSVIDKATLANRATDLRPTATEFRTGDTSLRFAFPHATYRVRGQGYMCMFEHSFAMGDLARGEAAGSEGAWVLMPPDADAVGPPEIEWPEVVAKDPVPPLVVRDSPPEDLPQSPIAAGSYYGLCGHGGLAYFPLWQAAGVQWLRAGFGWAAAEPTRGEDDFSAMDAVVAEAQAAGIRLIGLIHGTPGWAAREGTSISPPTDLALWERYVQRLTRRYRGRVHVWEIWNEPDIGQFWSGTAADYVALLAAAYRGAKRGNPGCLVMSAGLDGPGEHFLQEMIDLGAMEHCDLVGFHPYAGDPKLAEERIRAVWRILNFHQVRKPIWVTEVGWQSGGWKTGPGVVDSEATKAAYLSEIYERLSPLAEVVCWYVSREAGAMFGLVRPDGQSLVLNPAYHTYRDAAVPNAAGWELSGPDRVEAKAGQTSRFRWQATNRTGAALRLRAHVYEPVEWARVDASPQTVQAGETASIAVTLSPPVYAVPGKLACVLVASSRGGPAEPTTFTLDLENQGDSYAVTIERRWAIRVDEDGNKIGSWVPTARLITIPGGHMRQEVRIVNQGSADETFHLSLGGTAAAWTTGFPRDAHIKAGGDAWLGIVISPPKGTGRGTYPLVLTATSSTHPQVSHRISYNIPVGSDRP